MEMSTTQNSLKKIPLKFDQPPLLTSITNCHLFYVHKNKIDESQDIPISKIYNNITCAHICQIDTILIITELIQHVTAATSQSGYGNIVLQFANVPQYVPIDTTQLCFLEDSVHE